MHRSILLTSLVILITFVPHSRATNLTINPGIEYQTIEGFGSFAQCLKYTDQAYTTFLHDDFGFTMARMQVPNQFEPQNENSDPNTLDITKFNMSSLTRCINTINGLKRYSDVRFIATVWTPPAWMKDLSRDPAEVCSDGVGACGGHLKTTMYDEFGEYLAAFCKAIKQQTGVDLYAISLQNESAFIESYVSCVYTPEEYRDALKAVGARFVKEGLNVKLFGAEDMATDVATRNYAQTIGLDEQAKTALSAFAVHGYTNGVAPLQNRLGIQVWRSVGGVVKKYLGSKPVWMTETSGFPVTWDGALQLAGCMYQALRYGNISAWLFWSDAESNGQESSYALLTNYNHTKRSLASKHYYKWVRPGATRIESTNPDSSNLYISVFRHKENKTLTIVCVNYGGATTLSFPGQSIPLQLRKFTTSSSKNCVDEGLVASSGAISIDGSSVTTLFGENFSPIVNVHKSEMLNKFDVKQKLSKETYTLSGEKVYSKDFDSKGIYLSIIRESKSGKIAKVKKQVIF